MGTFTATLKTAGTQSITATDTVSSTITSSQTGITISPAAASRLQVSAPASATAGTPFNITVTAKVPYGNTATGYTGTVQFTSSDGAAVLPANYTFGGTDNGVHTFTVTLKTADRQTVTATDISTNTFTGTSGSITVSPAAASSFARSAARGGREVNTRADMGISDSCEND